MSNSDSDSSRRPALRYYGLFIPLVWGLSLLLPLLPLWQNLERQFFDLLTVLTLPEAQELPLVIVEIDQPTLSNMNLTLPWPRGIYGDLIDRLDAAGAAVIGIDVIFAGISVPEEDARLAEAVGNAGPVVLAADIEQIQRLQFNLIERVDPAAVLLSAGAIPGLAGVDLDADNTLRRVPNGEGYFWQEVVRAWDPELPSITGADYDEQRWIRYLAPAASFQYFSVYQVLRNLVPPENFAGKIVLVGLNLKTQAEPGQLAPDTFQTPLFAQVGPVSGVELQGLLVSNALLQRSIVLLSPATTYLLSLLFAIAGVAACRDWRPVSSTVGVALAILFLLLLSYDLFDSYDRWFQSLATLFSVVLFYLASGGWANLRDYRQKQFIRSAFERYLSPPLIARMLQDPDAVKLGGERKKITVLFTDLAGFTSLSEQMGAEDVAQFLNDHLDAMTELVLKHGGTIDKFIGDSVMAFWGAPLEDTQQELQACRCAMAMQKKQEAMSAALEARGLPQTSVRIGINTGEVIVGNMGSHQRFDYTVVGDDVNLASRLEGVNKLYATTILVAESTASALTKKIELMPVDRVIVKGKSKAVDIYTIGDICRHRDRVSLAIDSYRAANWREASSRWTRLLEVPELKTLAQVYLERIENLKDITLSVDWNGASALEKL